MMTLLRSVEDKYPHLLAVTTFDVECGETKSSKTSANINLNHSPLSLKVQETCKPTNPSLACANPPLGVPEQYLTRLQPSSHHPPQSVFSDASAILGA